MTFTGFSRLVPKHKAFVHLAERCIGPAQWAQTCKVVKECLLLGAHEGADLDILLPAALFYRSDKLSYIGNRNNRSDKSLEEHLHFVQNILESIEFYTDKKIHQVIQAIQENSEEINASEMPVPVMPLALSQKYTSKISLILHDAIILASLENLYTDTAKNMINKKAGLFRMIAAEARKKLLLK